MAVAVIAAGARVTAAPLVTKATSIRDKAGDRVGVCRITVSYIPKVAVIARVAHVTRSAGRAAPLVTLAHPVAI